MHRRNFIRRTTALVGVGAIATKPVAAKGKGNGKGGNNNSDDLVNAEVTEDGAVVATDDNFVISNQEITVDDQDFYEDLGATNIIYNNGYSGEIFGNHIVVNVLAHDPLFGIRADGGRVDVYDNEVKGEDELSHQFLGIALSGGASGTIEDNKLEGAHRVGILANGHDTNATIRDNEVAGVGPKTGGWAENGIQISRGATANIQNNVIEDLWWDNDAWESSGIMVFGASDSIIQRNTIRNTDAGIALFGGFGVEAGDNNNVIHNDIEVTRESEVYHEGVFVMGENNGIRQNRIQANNGDVGIWVFDGADNTKLIRNHIDGWDEPIVDAGAKTKLPRPFDLTS